MTDKRHTLLPVTLCCSFGVNSTGYVSRYKSLHSSELTLASFERAYPTCTVHRPVRTIGILCAKVSTILKIPQRSNTVHPWRNAGSIVDSVELENASTGLISRRKILTTSHVDIFWLWLKEKTFFGVVVHRPEVALVRCSTHKLAQSWGFSRCVKLAKAFPPFSVSPRSLQPGNVLIRHSLCLAR